MGRLGRVLGALARRLWRRSLSSASRLGASCRSAGAQGGSSAWTPLGGTAPGSANTVAVVGQTVYDATSSQGVWAWNGSSWSQVGDLGASAADVHSLTVSGSVLYAATAGGVWEWDISAATPAWRQLGGSGSGSAFAAGALAVMGSDIYALVGNPYGSPSGQAQVWEWNGTTWSAVGASTDPLYATEVRTLAPSSSTLYAGSSDGVWEWNASSGAWAQVGGASSAFAGLSVDSLVASGSDLYATVEQTQTSTGQTIGGGVWEWDGTSWSRLGSPSTAPNDENAWGLAVAGSTLYAADAGDGVYAWDGSAWSNVGSLPVYGASGATVVYTMAASGTTLYAGYGYGADVWQWNGSSWAPLGPPASAALSLLSANGNLYAGTDGGVLTWNGSGWQGPGDFTGGPQA